MDLITDAIIITIVGMSFVFFFLVVQILVTNFASKLGAKYSYMLPEPEVKKPAPKAAADDTAIVAAIAAALHQKG